MRRYGKDALKKQRYHCERCQKTFIWKVRSNKALRLRHWFQFWVSESCSIKLLCELSGYSKFKLNSIKNYWLQQTPEGFIDFPEVQYMVYDATYFHKEGCLLNLMNAQTQEIISHLYIRKESFKEAYPWFSGLRAQGLNPKFITTDGFQPVLRAMGLVWPGAKLQRCLYHLKHEGMRWLRTYPKTEAGRQLRSLLSTLTRIKTLQERDIFIGSYIEWLRQYRDFTRQVPGTTVAGKDLKRTVVLLNNALPDMFYYLEDRQVHSTTNALEGFHSRLKTDYQRHRGLSQEHRIQYIHWYCYFENRR